jgi:hypothetical protein
VLRIHRPFSYINSRIYVYDPLSKSETSPSNTPLDVQSMNLVGEAQQQWAPLRRKYNLFVHRDLELLERGREPLKSPESESMGMAQFASVNEPWLSWDFSLRSIDGTLLGSVNRSWRGLGRELFTDTGAYALRMDDASLSQDPKSQSEQQQLLEQDRQIQSVSRALQKPPGPGLSLDQRAVMLSTAISIDYDYFSRHSGSGSFMPVIIPMGSGAGEAGAAGAAGASGAGVAEAGAAAVGTEAAGSAIGGAVGRGVGASALEGAAGAAGAAGIAGAGTLASHDAMGGGSGLEQNQSIWGEDLPGSESNQESSDPGGDTGMGSTASGEGGGLFDVLSEMFDD